MTGVGSFFCSFTVSPFFQFIVLNPPLPLMTVPIFIHKSKGNQ